MGINTENKRSIEPGVSHVHDTVGRADNVVSDVMKHTTRTGFSHLQRRSVSGLIWPFQDNLNRAVFHHGSKDDLSVWRRGEETKKQGVVDASLWTQRTLYERIRSHSYQKCLLLA